MIVRILAVAAAGVAFLAGPPPAAARSPRQVKWEELSMVVGKTVSIAMPGAVIITGTATAVEPDGLVVRIKSTTDAKAWPKGPSRLPRANLHTLEMRTKGSKYRIIGTVLGSAAGLVAGALAAIKIDGIFSSNHNGGKAAAAFVGIAGGMTAGGCLLGNAADRSSTTIEILP